MAIPFENKKFRINPIELAIFAVATFIFVRSGYSLIYAHNGQETPTLAASAPDPVAPASQDSRTPAAAFPKTFTEVTIGCDPTIENSVSANKVRFVGSLCKPANMPAPASVTPATGEADATDTDADTDTTEIANAPVAAKPAIADDVSSETTADVKQISIVNTSANVAATVFPDLQHQRYVTDYVTLAQGKNLIYVQYQFKDGKTLGREYTVTKN